MSGKTQAPAERVYPRTTHLGTHRGVWIPVILLILHCVLLPLAPAIPAHRFLFVLFFITAVLLPGYLLSTMIADRTALPAPALLSLVCGTAVTYGLLTVFAILNWKLRFMGIAAPLVSATLLVLRYRRWRHKPAGGGESEILARKTPAPAAVVLVAVLVFACVLIAAGGDPLYYSSDSPDHLAYIRTISRTGDAFPDRFLYPDGGTLTRDIRKGLVHAMWGTLNALTGRIDALAVWPIVSMIGSVSVLLALFCAGSILMGSTATGLIAAFIFLLVYNDGLKGYQLITMAYTFPFGKIFYIAFLVFVIRYLMEGMLYRDWYSKAYRKLYRIIHGGRFRWTIAHLPLDGIFPPDRWHPFTVMRDRFTLAVPPNLSPGSYTMRTKLVVVTQYPNHTIRDFMDDRDSLTGAVGGEVVVE